MSDIDKIPFDQAYISIPVGKSKIQENEYLLSGKFKVVDQGQNLVAGYSDLNCFVRYDIPYIVFGDHTKIVKFIDFPFIAGADGVRLYKASEHFDPEYLFYYLKNLRLPNDGYGRHSKYLSDFLVPKPKIETQRQIASRLKAQLAEVEKARKAMEVQLQETVLLRKKFLEFLFAELDSEPRLKIGDFAETTSGSTPSRSRRDYWEPKEIPWVKTTEVAFYPITKSEEFISRKALDECSLKLLPANSVLVAMYGQGKTRGQSAILRMEATINQACFAILPNDVWEPEFLQLWLRHSYQDLRNISDDRGGNQANLNGSIMKSFEVPAPTKKKQLEIVKKVSSALKEIDSMFEKYTVTLAEINALPNILLSQAFNCQNE